MTESEVRILEAAIRSFVRFGPQKTTMADVAREAEVSRQTVYTTFGGKDGLIAGAIRLLSDRSLERARERAAAVDELAEQLDAFFEETVVRSYEMLQSAADPDDLLSGHNRVGKAEIEASRVRQRGFLVTLLSPYAEQIRQSGQSVEQLAHYAITVGMSLKHPSYDREEFDGLLQSLKKSVLAIARD